MVSQGTTASVRAQFGPRNIRPRDGASYSYSQKTYLYINAVSLLLPTLNGACEGDVGLQALWHVLTEHHLATIDSTVTAAITTVAGNTFVTCWMLGRRLLLLLLFLFMLLIM
ncbi:hypothetical protein E2C01_001031 [Portunus trituberculatus]|uniref:Uncharacterized protein n=1 Tax=Portunus trituberculatus TaxID=210409 RepID=A0A5B7CGR3_PORTR|nr:hypothetical protein [Portunus trituberculatus]